VGADGTSGCYVPNSGYGNPGGRADGASPPAPEQPPATDSPEPPEEQAAEEQAGREQADEEQTDEKQTDEETTSEEQAANERDASSGRALAASHIAEAGDLVGISPRVHRSDWVTDQIEVRQRRDNGTPSKPA
jgi:hypothetical protein